MANSDATKERIELNEAIGFFGHKIREVAGINPSEQEIILKDGKPLLIDVIPAIKTTYFNVDEQGNVTHEQEFLDNDLGKAAMKLYDQGIGGFSWALQGQDGRGSAPNVARKLLGFDYTYTPNFITKGREAVMYSSMSEEDKIEKQEALFSAMEEVGFSESESQALLSSLQKNSDPELEDTSMTDLIISSLAVQIDEQKELTQKEIIKNSELIAQNDQRCSLLSGVIDNSPFFISEHQKNAFINMSNEEDAKELSKLLSSMQKTDFSGLPNFEKEKTEFINEEDPKQQNTDETPCATLNQSWLR